MDIPVFSTGLTSKPSTIEQDVSKPNSKSRPGVCLDTGFVASCSVRAHLQILIRTFVTGSPPPYFKGIRAFTVLFLSPLIHGDLHVGLVSGNITSITMIGEYLQIALCMSA